MISSVALVVSSVICAANALKETASFVPSPQALPIRFRRPSLSHRYAPLSMVKVGEMAPDFSLKDQSGKVVKLSSFKNKKSVVVFFYPADMTPGCTKQAQAFNTALDDFKKLGAEVIGVSSDADHSEFISAYGLKMTLLSDIGGEVRKQWQVPGAMFGALPGRVTYVIGKDGIVKKVYDNLLDSESHIPQARAALA
ncbi:unnamed protein product [Vitrella brassicaformis CCMP3155]|uniref:thioredoxin-dependent peroxiredoxin n=2 Tax=Vitrella brassicaformis TaxID=1169539 RepID=A0A0G4FWI1_VITBC|nr:unnamed protein product [Vitrella brassicaformis CCMP3155]|mmetsp:Transcript_20759/g.59229  ORF Transcript_20759/g.59229 Transcript_20759/m.59229 type:complete len:196 (+) Transcript_20759:62-649(+)|eukprot:CEM19577.1 unnamed protein product [Vitrella brassicaformis CCMP3155]